MSKRSAWIVFLIVTAILLATSKVFPYLLSDEKDSFLSGLMGWELISFLGVILTLTLASAANLHLELNRLEGIHDIDFSKAKKAIRFSVIALLTAMLVAILLLIFRHLIVGIHWIAMLNSVAILIIFFNIAILTDMTLGVLNISLKKNNS